MSDHAEAASRDPAGTRGVVPRQARALATRGAILTAAAEEFATSSYHEASLSRILERSKVTKGALYFHFVSKESIALAVVDEMDLVCRDLVDRSSALGLDPLRTAAQVTREVQDALAGTVLRAGQRLSTEGFAGPHRPGWPFRYWEEVFCGLFTRAADEGLLRSGVDPASFSRTAVDTGAGAFVVSLGVTHLADFGRRVCENWELLLGCAADPAWLESWHAEGGMAAVMGPHLLDDRRDGHAVERGWVADV